MYLFYLPYIICKKFILYYNNCFAYLINIYFLFYYLLLFISFSNNNIELYKYNIIFIFLTY